MLHQASFQFVQQSSLSSCYEKNLGCLLWLSRDHPLICGKKAKVTIRIIICFIEKRSHLEKHWIFISGNHFTNALLFNPHNSARWILLSTFYRGEKWGSKLCTAGNFHRLLIKTWVNTKKNWIAYHTASPEDNIDNDNKNNVHPSATFLLSKKVLGLSTSWLLIDKVS